MNAGAVFDVAAVAAPMTSRGAISVLDDLLGRFTQFKA
jgi:hypothetical protein